MTDSLSRQDRSLLLKLARETILRKLGQKEYDPDDLKAKLSDLVNTEKRGTFVSLHKQGTLRGCIGNIEPVKTIVEGVSDNAEHAAFKDSRFKPLALEELKDTRIEISILTRPKKLEYADVKDLIAQLRPKIDGVIVQKHYRSATFLPQVWDQLPDPKNFLSQLCMKAGLASNEWKTGQLEVSTYQVQMFEETRV
jgi:AmmeMemoRadiSam system protein A